ncbi:hypothetical protein WR25_02599 [Diploscapter pachys]|uniref:Glutamyl-tRNA(Gln) amidotransferase subunit B, mitochondrial n=1 Tax=Diploscapter pachys TaxID=2018661 RepID=A0A2A2L9W0_9BILA|nr:hypothetical protein WR25_02599 [Diploscapter pachys]
MILNLTLRFFRCKNSRVFCGRFLSQASTSQNVELKPRENYKPVIGLELHVQLSCRTKLFSRTPVLREGDEAGPNRLVGAFDMATPGTLPKLNKKAVMLALQMARLFKCEIPERSRFDRKHYFYADMPAGYQITQHDMPVAKNGVVKFHVYAEDMEPYEKSVRITQLQLEQDSGKTIHVGNRSLIDYNRAGIALVEIVTEPDFETALEAECFVEQLRLQLMHYGICEGELHRGHLRTDANVSLSEDGKMGVRTEIKNIQSLRNLHTAINFEIDRQYRILAAGGVVQNETRATDMDGRTVPMRDKEEETDYRFMVEPNLPMIKVNPEWLYEIDKGLSSSQPRYMELISKYGFPARRAVYYAENPLMSAFVAMCESRLPRIRPEDFVKWLYELKDALKRTKVEFPPQSQFFADQFMTIVEYVGQDKITNLLAMDLLRAYANQLEIRTAEQWITEESLWKMNDLQEIERILDSILEKNPKLKTKVLAGSRKGISELARTLVAECRKCVDRDEADKIVEHKLKTLIK